MLLLIEIFDYNFFLGLLNEFSFGAAGAPHMCHLLTDTASNITFLSTVCLLCLDKELTGPLL